MLSLQSTPFKANTVGTASWCPRQRESEIAGVYFSQTTEIYFCLGFSCCPCYRGVRYSEVSARRELTVLRLERQEKDFLKSTSKSQITLSFLFIWNLNDIYVHAFPRKPYPNSDQNRQNLYPFSDQNGAKTLPFGAAHTYKANIREYPPPPPPTGIVRNIPPCVIQSSKHLPIHHILCRTTGTLGSWGWPAK